MKQGIEHAVYEGLGTLIKANSKLKTNSVNNFVLNIFIQDFTILLR